MMRPNDIRVNVVKGNYGGRYHGLDGWIQSDVMRELYQWTAKIEQGDGQNVRESWAISAPIRKCY